MFTATAGSKSSEFKAVGVASLAAALLAGFKPEMLSPHDAATLIGTLVSVYTASRGAAKFGKASPTT